MPANPFFTCLKPFEADFRQGTALLMYHKLGRPPRGTKIKGLYVAADLFAQQVSELQAAGFVSALPAAVFQPVDPAKPRVVFTFDDGFVSVLELGLAPLAQAGFQAIQYLVADRLGGVNEWDAHKGEPLQPLMDEKQVRDWLAAGHAIGAHTLTHPHLTRIPLAQAREEIVASKKKLEDRFGRAIEHFCYPYGDCNAAIKDLVAEAGYQTGCTTEMGINLPSAAPLGLKRYMARHQSLSLKTLLARLTGR